MSIIYINPYQFAAAYDPDAQSYITAVETADGQALEVGVKDAINAFVVGCKSDGIWNAIKASCILAGARTLAGALVPLVGTAPTNYNFASADYDRETGLVGDGSTKYLDANRASNADPQNNKHISMYVTEKTGSGPWIGAYTSTTSVTWAGPGNSLTSDIYALNSSSLVVVPRTASSTGFYGISRASSTSLSYLLGSQTTTTTVSNTSAVPGALPTEIYRIDRTPSGSSIVYSASRLSFYSVGESLDLALLDPRVTTLVSAIGAAIP